MKTRDAGIAAAATSAVLIGVGSHLLRARGDGEAAKSFLQLDGRMLLHGTIALVDSKLLSVANTLAVIASSSEAQSGDWKQIEPLLSRMAQDYPQSLFQWTPPDGSVYFLNTGLHTAKVSDRHYFKEAMAGRRTLAELLTSRATGIDSVITAVPVKAARKIAGLFVVTLFLKPLSQWLAQSLRLSENTIFGAADSEGMIVLDDDPARIFRDLRGLGSPSLNRVFSKMQSGREGTATYELNECERRVVYATSPLTGWHYLLGEIH